MRCLTLLSQTPPRLPPHFQAGCKFSELYTSAVIRRERIVTAALMLRRRYFYQQCVRGTGTYKVLRSPTLQSQLRSEKKIVTHLVT